MRKIFRHDGAANSPLNARRWFVCMESQLAEMSRAYSSSMARKEDLPKLKELYAEAKEIFTGIREDYKSWNKIVRELEFDPMFNQRRETTLDRKLRATEFTPEDREKVLSLSLGISDASVKVHDLYIEALNIVDRKKNQGGDGVMEKSVEQLLEEDVFGSGVIMSPEFYTDDTEEQEAEQLKEE